MREGCESGFAWKRMSKQREQPDISCAKDCAWHDQGIVRRPWGLEQRDRGGGWQPEVMVDVRLYSE